MFSDLVHERLTARDYASTNPLHGFFVDRRGRVRIASRWWGASTPAAMADAVSRSRIADLPAVRDLAGQPNVVVSGPFFVFPFNAPLTTPTTTATETTDRSRAYAVCHSTIAA